MVSLIGAWGPRWVVTRCSAPAGCERELVGTQPAPSGWLCDTHNARVRQRCAHDECRDYLVIKTAYVEPGWRCPRHRTNEGEATW